MFKVILIYIPTFRPACAILDSTSVKMQKERTLGKSERRPSSAFAARQSIVGQIWHLAVVEGGSGQPIAVY